MPIYEYQPDDAEKASCEYCQPGFEELQKVSDEPLTVCPKCGAAIHRVLSAFAVNGLEKKLLGKKNLEEKGFTQYKKAGDGYYEKTAGKGPDVIKR